MIRYATVPAMLLAAALSTGCKTAAVDTKKEWTKADVLPFEVNLDGQPAVFKADAVGPIKAVNGPVAVVEQPVANDGTVKLDVPASVGKPRSILVEVVPLGADDKSAGLSTIMKLAPNGEGKLERVSPGGNYAMSVTVTPETGAPKTARVKFQTKPKK